MSYFICLELPPHRIFYTPTLVSPQDVRVEWDGAYKVDGITAVLMCRVPHDPNEPIDLQIGEPLNLGDDDEATYYIGQLPTNQQTAHWIPMEKFDEDNG